MCILKTKNSLHLLDIHTLSIEDHRYSTLSDKLFDEIRIDLYVVIGLHILFIWSHGRDRTI